MVHLAYLEFHVEGQPSARAVLNEIATTIALSSSLTYVVVKEGKNLRTDAKT